MIPSVSVLATNGPSGPLVALVNTTATATSPAQFALSNTGTASATQEDILTTMFTWLLSGAAGDYEVRAQLISGSLSSGTTGATYQLLSTTRTWSRNAAAGTAQTAVIDLFIRKVGTTTDLASCRVTLAANRT